MIDRPYYSTDAKRKAYFAGLEDGIVTAGGQAACKPLLVLDAHTMVVVTTARSLDNGRYLVRGLEAGKEYLLMARDTQRGYEDRKSVV